MKSIKVVFYGDFLFPYGSASASRIRNFARGIQEIGAIPRIVALPILLERSQDIRDNYHVYKGITYESVLGYGIPYSRNSKVWTRPIWYFDLLKASRNGWRRMLELINNKEVDVIIIYAMDGLSLEPIIRMAHRRNIVVVADIVEWPTKDFFRGGICNPLYWTSKRFTYISSLLCDGVIAISSKIEEQYRKRGANVLRIPALVEPDLFPYVLKNDMKTNNKSYRLAYLGTLETKDDPFVMIDVIRTIIKEGFSVSLDIVGASENMENGKIISSICEADPVLKGIVHFHGRVSDDELYSYLQMADALLLIKMGDPISQAAFPTRLPELLLTGRPVITTNVGDVSEYLHDNVHVIIPPAGDVRAIADRVITLIKERGLGEEIGIHGRKRAIEVFSYQAYVHQFLNFISQFRDLSS